MTRKAAKLIGFAFIAPGLVGMVLALPVAAFGGSIMEVVHLAVRSEGDRAVYYNGHNEVALGALISNTVGKVRMSTMADSLARDTAKELLSGTNAHGGAVRTQKDELLVQSRVEPCVGVRIDKTTRFDHVTALLAALKAAGIGTVRIHCDSDVMTVDLTRMRKEAPEADPSAVPVRESHGDPRARSARCEP